MGNASRSAHRPSPWARRVLIAGYYVWLPLVYVAVYIPLIVPRLTAWPKIPTVVLVLTLGPFVAVCTAVGAVLSHRQILSHGVAVALVLQLTESLGGLLHAPGMGENWAESDPTFFWLVLLPVKVLILIILAEAGHVVLTIARRCTSRSRVPL
jgi:hypothetical protein